MLVMLLIAAVLTASPAPPPSDGNAAPTSDELDALQQLYDSSCGSRGYGEYDDVCIQITQRLNEARAAAEKAQARATKAKHRPPPPARPPTPPSEPTPAPLTTPASPSTPQAAKPQAATPQAEAAPTRD